MPDGTVAIVGGGGHALVIYEAALAAGLTVIGFYDDEPAPGLEKHAERLGSVSDAATADLPIILGVGGLAARRHLLSTLLDGAWLTIAHPTAIVSPTARIGPGTYIGANVVVNGRAEIGAHAILNTACVVEHDCTIGENAHIAPRAVLGGGARVGDDTLIGIGATVLPLVTVGNRCVVSGGGAAAHDVPDRTTAIGVPARAARPTR